MKFRNPNSLKPYDNEVYLYKNGKYINILTREEVELTHIPNTSKYKRHIKGLITLYGIQHNGEQNENSNQPTGSSIQERLDEKGKSISRGTRK